MRRLMFALATLTFASAFLLYGVNYDARDLEKRARAKERAIAKTRASIAVLRAERAYLSRPSRIEPLARALGLSPLSAAQIAASPEAAR